MPVVTKAPKRRWNPLYWDRFITLAVTLVCGGFLLLALLGQLGCQAVTEVTPATSKADRTIIDDRGSEEWEVIVEPKGAAR